MPRTLKPIRWTIDKAASEFGIDRKTLANRIRAGGISPGDDARFSTKDICRAVFTDGEAARASLAISQRELIDLKKQQLAGNLVDPKQCQQLWDAAIIALRQKISDAPIPENVKRDILKDLQTIPIDEYKTNVENERNQDIGDSEVD